jgi:DNA-binding response OmpR family regulator
MNKILLVEDEDLREAVKAILLIKNYQVIEAAGGKEALEKIKENMPDLVLSDIMMPGMNGIDFFKEFKLMPGSYLIPFIFISARTAHEDIRSAMNLGADDYITKPFTAKELLDAVENKLAKRKVFQQNLFEVIARKIPHELRTPLVASLGYTEIIMDQIGELSNEELFELLSNIKSSNQRLHKVIEELMNEFEDKFMRNNLIVQR